MWQSLVLTFLSFLPFEEQGGSLWLEGNFVYLGIVIIVNINVLTSTNNHTWISLLFQIGSIIITLVVGVILNLFTFSVLFGTSWASLGSIEFYYVLLLMLLAIVMVDIGINYINRKVRERMIKIARVIRKRIKNLRHKPSIESKGKDKKITKNLNRGFAFAQEPGSAPQILDKIKNDSVMRKSMHYTVKKVIDSEGRRESHSRTILCRSSSKMKGEKLDIEKIMEESED